MSEFHDQIARYRAAIEAFLQAQFCQELPQKRLFDAMRYSLLAGGKRIRPVLTLEFCRICGGDWQSAVPFACALEMIHTYSLIHDDLPCMDNDDYRRGRLTNHKVFGEALAVLAGDGLLTAAFETAANAPADPGVIVRAIRILSEQAGELGIPGNVKGVIGWMKEMKQQVKPCIEGHVVVVGAGNTAMDAARVAKRMGAASSTIVYRRTKKEMPADEHELKLAIDEGVKLVELAAPVEQKDGKLVCNQMKLGDPDASGRRSPVATGETFELPCDLVISAIGEKVDAKLMAENGIEMGRKGPAFQTNVENVWSAGDAHRGPATVVEGIADAAAFAEAVIGKAHTYEIPEQAYPAKADAIAKKGILKMASCACCEGGRCLDCNTVCENCVDSCPNRANVVIKLSDGRHQILHIDKMCNECGNCTAFCPYASEPCKDKLTLFQTPEDMDDSRNFGFCFLPDGKVRARLTTETVGDPDELPADAALLVRTIRDSYSYLYR